MKSLFTIDGASLIPMTKLALLDGHSLSYRAFYALPADLATTAGQATNAVFGFTSMLIKLLGDERPDALVVAWDVRGPTFRTEEYGEYKAQRKAPPDLFRDQIPLISEVLETLQIAQIGVGGFEADDVIATLATQAKEAGWETVIITGDRDAFQLVEPAVTVLYTRRGISDTVRADEAWIMERYGVSPHQYIDYAALRGDPSDNLPGVPGVGEKTASRLITGYGDLEGIYEHLEEQAPRIRQNLEKHKEAVFLNRRLIRLVRDVPFPEVSDGVIALETFMLREWEREDVRRLFDALDFRALWERLLPLGGQIETVHRALEVGVSSVVSKDGLDDLAGPLVVEPVNHQGELAGVMVAAPDGGRFVPTELIGIIATRAVEEGVIAHDAKHLVRLFLDEGFSAPRVVFDTAMAAYLINPAQRAPDLVDLAHRELDLDVDPSGDSRASGGQRTFSFDQEEGPDLDATARRVTVIGKLMNSMQEQLDTRGATELFTEIELPLIPILAQMEQTGIGVDRDFLENLGSELRSRLGELVVAIHDAAGGSFNINSTLQLREVLYGRLGLPILKKTPKGMPSTDASVLRKLRAEHQVVDTLLRFRELEKLRSTYVDALLPLIDGDGRVRGRFNQMAVATGRLSQEQPNLQNLPMKSEEGRSVRRAFVAKEGSSFLVADYSQIELRILAHLSGDQGLIEAFSNDRDIHKTTAARVAGITPAEVSPDARRMAKAVNFGLLYGMEAFGLAQFLEISREEAEEQIEAYFSEFPEVRAFMKGIVEGARTTGYTTTILGRRRYLPELLSDNFRMRQTGERMALNAPIQGAAADIIKKAMVELDIRLREMGSDAVMVLQVHDELVLEVPQQELDRIAELMTDVMEKIVELRVPLKVDIASGRTLADCKS